MHEQQGVSEAEEGRVVDTDSDPAARALAELHSRLGDGAHTQLLVTDGSHWTAVPLNDLAPRAGEE